VLYLTCHVIVIRSLSWNVSQSDLSLSVAPNWQRFSVVMQTLKCLGVPSNHHWKCYLDVNWKGYPDINWKGYTDIVDYVFTELQMKFLPYSGSYKSTSRGRELRRIQTHRPHTIGSKEPKPWSPRWVRQKVREKNNGLSPNDPNHDEKPLADAEIPLCKCDLDCQSHMSLEHNTYSRRYWSCPQPTCLYHWDWDEEKPRKGSFSCNIYIAYS
jgi:hypothetical protein